MPDGFAELVDLPHGGGKPAPTTRVVDMMAARAEADTAPPFGETFLTDYERRLAERRHSRWARLCLGLMPRRVLQLPIAGMPPARMMRLGIGAALVVVGAVFTFDRFFALHTSDAMLSAAPITLRAQIDGVVGVNPLLLGGIVEAQSTVGSITDESVDESHVAELRSAVRIAEEQVVGLRTRIGQLETQTQETRGHVASFRTARTEQLAARLREADAAIATAQTRLRLTNATLHRAEALYATQTVSGAALDQARAAAAAAQSDLAVATQRQSAAKSELAAASAGVFALDAATDRSVSQQRFDVLQTRAGDLSSEFATARVKLDGLRSQLAVEQARLARRQHADILLPVRARLIRVAVQDGELVSRGQEIATAVDCAQPMVRADVSEAVFRKLYVGMPGEFRIAGDGVRHMGRIVQMVSPLDDTQPQRQAETTHHRVMLRIEPEGLASSCQVGRMGQLSF